MTKPGRFSLRPLPADLYAELAVLRATAEASSYEIVCAGVLTLSRLSPAILRAVLEETRTHLPSAKSRR